MSALTDRIDALEAQAMKSPDGLLPDEELEALAHLYTTLYGDTPSACRVRRGAL